MVRDWPAGTVQLPVAMYGLPTLVQLPETLPDTNVEATAWLAKVQNECQAGGGLGNPVSSSGPVGGRISVSGVKPIAVFSFDVIGLMAMAKTSPPMPFESYQRNYLRWIMGSGQSCQEFLKIEPHKLWQEPLWLKVLCEI